MQKFFIFIFISLFSVNLLAQSKMTPELLWQLGRVSAIGITEDSVGVIYSVRHYNMNKNKSSSQYYRIPIEGGLALKIEKPEGIKDKNISPDGKRKLISQEVKGMDIRGRDHHRELKKADVLIYDDLMYRHWDTWFEGKYNHVFISDIKGKNKIDIMEGQRFHCPTMPFGGDEDFIWNPDGTEVLYVTKKEVGRNYAVSTNTDIFSYNLETKLTTNITRGRKGYDTSPAFSSKGTLAWLSMKRDGYEADKNDILINTGNGVKNLTAVWDGTVSSFYWSTDGNTIYFTAPIGGTKQLFSVNINIKDKPEIVQITEGQFDVTAIVGQVKEKLVVSRTDMNHALELYVVNLIDSTMKQLTHVNDEIYQGIKLSRVEKRMITTTDNKEMVTWVIYPPNFNPEKKYPTLLYCQGGPQGALSQFYSFRWNFQVMAAKGYIVVAPNRRGMPGHGVEWNEQISKDYGGQNMQDYLSAIDALAKEDYVDEERLGAVGASYGGYSVFYLAGIHENRFKSFISHDGLFNLRSMYGTTEELFFVNWDLGGPYWDKKNEAAQKTYNEFNPINMVDKWNTPILIYQGGIDYRVPIGQGLEAFQAAQLKGIKSRLVYLPKENHWVLAPQNGLVWQREFFRWLRETL